MALNVSARQDDVYSDFSYEISYLKLFFYGKKERSVSGIF
jgi:hypothetical protein